MDEVKNINTDSNSWKRIVSVSVLSPEAKELLDEVKEEKNSTDFKRLVCLKSDGTIFNFNVFKCSLDFVSHIYNGKISLEKAKKSQNKMLQLLDHLKKYNSTKLGNITSREKTLNDVENLYKNKSNVIKTFENGVFSCNYGFQKEKPDMPDKALPNWVKVSKKRDTKRILKEIIYKVDHSVVTILILITQRN